MKNLKLTLIVLTIATSMFAQTPDEAINLLENETGVGVRAMGMGNAFVAVANDYTATYWNPAGLTLINQSEVSADLYHIKFNNEVYLYREYHIGRSIFHKTKLNWTGV